MKTVTRTSCGMVHAVRPSAVLYHFKKSFGWSGTERSSNARKFPKRMANTCEGFPAFRKNALAAREMALNPCSGETF